MRVKLLEHGSQPGEQREIAINKEEFLVGRGPDCDLRLQASAVSRHHFLLRLRGSDLALIDLGSSNGTYLNGTRVRSQAALHHGDKITVGERSFVVEVDDQEGIDWGGEPNTDPTAVTARLPDIRKQAEAARKDKGKPPGTTGGERGASAP
jgi:pSer/pThr/pTyr-binding forkhead associated (FHA) protein